MKVSTRKILTEHPKHIPGGRAFKHSGDAGDILYSLPTVRVAGGGDLFLVRSHFTRVKTDEASLANIKPLLMAQPYISSVELHRGQAVAFDLDLFRSVGAPADNICKRHLRAFSFPESECDTPWLEVEPLEIAPVVINLTSRFRNPKMPWVEIIDRYGSNCIFIGHVEEWGEFRKFYEPDIIWQTTENLLQVARIIAGCEIFIGNQSCCLAIAEGLKKTIIQETCRQFPNCLFQRKRFFSVLDGLGDLPNIALEGQGSFASNAPKAGGGIEVKTEMPPAPSTCIVQLGRYGDLLNILPVAKHIADTEGAVAMVVHRDFLGLMEGVSYVQVIPWDGDFMRPHEAAKAVKDQFKCVLVSQPADSAVARERVCEAFNMESWRYGGYLDKWSELRLDIDRRDRAREDKLLDALGLRGQPFLLVNPHSQSSPFPQADQLVASIQMKWAPRFKVVDMRRFRAERYHDLLGLMDRALGLVTVDTASLHLAAASRVPVIALISDHLTPWHGSKPRCNIRLSMRYKEYQFREAEMHSAIEKLTTRPPRRISRLSLPITLLGIDPFMPARTLGALWACMREAEFADVALVCRPGTRAMGGDWKGVRPIFVDVGPDRVHRETLIIKRLHEFITQSHCLHCESDARLANPSAWRDEWLEYDFIGAPWPWPFSQPGFPDCTRDNCVGNTGFALISKRFAETLTAIANPTPDEARLSDVYICRTLRPQLEERGMKFAPEAVAERFSCEGRIFSNQLGFHGKCTIQLNGFRI